MKSFNQQTEHELDREQLDEELNKKVTIDEATAGDFLLGLGAVGGLLALKKGWDTFGKGSKLASMLAITKKGKAKVAQDKMDKEDEKQKEKDTTADSAARGYDKDAEGNIKKVKDAQAYKDKTDKAPPGWETSTGKGAFKKVKAGSVVQIKVADMLKKRYEAEREKGGQVIGLGAKETEDEREKRKEAEKAAKEKEAEKNKKEESLTIYAKDDVLKLTESDRHEVLKTLKGIMTITESNELQAIMALDDAGISAEINRKGEVSVKKKDLKKAQKIISKEFKKGGEPKLVGEEVVVLQPDDLVNLSTYIEMKMSNAAKKKKAMWAKSAGGKKSLLKSKKRALKVKSGSIKINKAKGRAMAKARKKGGIRNEFELGEGLVTEALGKLDKSVIDAFYYKKEKAGKVVSSDGDTLFKDGMGGQTIAQWLDPSGKIAISAVTDVKSTESILKYMKKSIPKGNFDKKSYKKFFGEELQRTAYELVSEARKKATANKPQWEQE